MHPKSSQENLLKRTNIVLALPSYKRQRLSVIRRGWCRPDCKKTERVIRSDVSEAHRLSLSARLLSAQHSQVKAKTAAAEALPTPVETEPAWLAAMTPRVTGLLRGACHRARIRATHSQ